MNIFWWRNCFSIKWFKNLFDLCEVLFNWVYFDSEIVLVLNDLKFVWFMWSIINWVCFDGEIVLVLNDLKIYLIYVKYYLIAYILMMKLFDCFSIKEIYITRMVY